MSDHFILLPRSGIRASDPAVATALATLASARSTQPPLEAELTVSAPGHIVRVIDSAQENGAKLVEMSPEAAAAVNRPGSPLRAAPVVTYALPERLVQPEQIPGVGAATRFTVACIDSVSGQPLAGCDVIAFESFATKSGAKGVTDAAGRVELRIRGGVIDRLYVYGPDTYWGAYRTSVAIGPGATIDVQVQPVDLAYVDAVRHYYGASRYDAQTGVKVGVIDTGVGPHTDLNIGQRRNTVTGEPAIDADDWFGHGTHVAGLIGSNGAPPTGLRGMAPGVTINAYRVFGQNADGATNYAILKAMIMAAGDGCDIVNLSLGGGPSDPIVAEAIADARGQGLLVMVAAGNGGRVAVEFPAAYTGSTAVSAIGLEGAFPAGSICDADIQRPPASTSDPKAFIAGFSNVGPQIAVTAPGVGVLSTLPNNRHGPMSGTSMASPVAAGAAACLLSRDAATFALARDRNRSAAIERMLQRSCRSLGFSVAEEGYGMPDPGLV